MERPRGVNCIALRRVAGVLVHYVHYVEQKNCTAMVRYRGYMRDS